MLSKSRIVMQGHSEYPWEAEALAFIRSELPDSDPFHVWELVELVDSAKGRIHEIDCLVLGFSALYLVEIKSGPGIYEGDATDWQRTAPAERARYMEPPYKLTNLKAKILKSLLERQMPRDRGSVWVQPLVFLSAPDVTLKLRAPGDQCVVTRKNFLRAVQFHELPGATDVRRPDRINRLQQGDIARALERIGIRQSEGAKRVGSYKLGEVLEEGPGYEDRVARHAERSGIRRRARIYLVPQQTTVDRRQTLLRAADREASILEELKDHTGILRIADYVTDSLVGPTVLFDHFEGIPLDAFLRSHPDLTFEKRVEVIRQVGLALAHCHSKKILHGALCPSAVLVHEDSAGAVSVRLYNFQLSGAASGTSTVHWSSLAAVPWGAYQAPELRDNPQARNTCSDLFSLGALAYFVLTGREPGATGAEVDRLLADQSGPHHLDPRTVNDQIPPDVAEAICAATELKPALRFDDVNEWLHEVFLEAVTAPSETKPVSTIDPLLAKREDILDDDLLVEKVLGQGASSRVLQVTRDSDGRTYALKVALSGDDDPRLDTEAKILQRLRHSNIVQFEDRRVIVGRTCVLMALAGNMTLSRSLAQEGTPSLDFAARYGEDLMLAMQHLEEEEILHRDIKPGNLGVGTAAKSAYRLTLFDFSLAFDFKATDSTSPALSQLGIGTNVYRDPFLRIRGSWDFAADRWSAAVTLHEMLTGVRPSFEPEGTSAIDPESKLVLAAERFDASVREQLVDFFRRALARDASARFESAQAMRKAWNAAFEIRNRPEQPRADAGTPAERTSWDESELNNIRPDAPIAALPLSSKALNALDRAGLTVADDLLALPDNRLSAIRGVGTKVAQQILHFRDCWRPIAEQRQYSREYFMPGYAGKDVPLSELALSSATKRAFQNAGLSGLVGLASAPRRQVESLAQRAKQSLPELRQLLEADQRPAVEATHPTSVAGWVEALLPKQKTKRRNLEVLFGLAEPMLGEFEIPIAEAAEALGMTRGGLSVAVTTTVPDWANHPAISELQLLLHSFIDPATPAMRVRELAQAILGRFNEPDASSLKLAQAATLARIVTAVEREQPDGLHWVRVNDCPWVVISAECAPVLRELGHTADELAKREILASPGEVTRLLRAQIDEKHVLASATDEQLATWASKASQIGALSSRLEIYPRGLPARRALELTSPVLTGELRVDRILTLVSSRYPEAEPLPLRPELDQLLERFGLKWHASNEVYARAGSSGYTLHTGNLTRLPTSLGSWPSSQREINPDVVDMRDFEEKMRSALQERKLRILCASKTYAVRTALALQATFGLTLADLDKLLTQQLTKYASEQEIAESNIYDTDRMGESSEDWSTLRDVMVAVADQVASELFPVKQPTLLVQPGLVARFDLRKFIARMIESAPSQSAACFMLVPGAEQTGVPVINGQFPLAELSPSDAIHVPNVWISSRKAAV